MPNIDYIIHNSFQDRRPSRVWKVIVGPGNRNSAICCA